MDHEQDEPLIEGLGHLPPGAFDEPEEAPELFARLLGETSAVVRRRRRIRTVLAVAAAILLFVAGAATERLLSRPEATSNQAPTVHIADAPRPQVRPLPANSRDLENRLAATQPEERASVLRQAGDDFLSSENADPEAALYCYQRLLDSEELTAVATPGEGDSWLLLYLKLARKTE